MRRERPSDSALIIAITEPIVSVLGSIFAALLPASPPHWLLFVLPPMIFVVEASWYSFVTLTFSARRPRAAYLYSKKWIDRAAGLVMGGLGVRLLMDGMRVR